MATYLAEWAGRLAAASLTRRVASISRAHTSRGIKSPTRSAAESTYQRPQIVRALYEAASALERQERFDRRRAQMLSKTGEPWSEEEDRKLLAAFDAGGALQELPAAHERTMGAVSARLLKYGRINT